MIKSIPVNGPSPYEVMIGHNLDSHIVDTVCSAGISNIAIIHQPPLLEPAQQLASSLQAAGVSVVTLPVPDAEAAKTLKVCAELWDSLAKQGFSRADAVIGLGGGAVTDLAGFVAAGWMRGIKVIQVPTTLLAMVDAAVGGKTGVNTAAGKNLVGAFHEPHAVFIDLERLTTLPTQEIVSGSAEIIKTGFIHDPVIIDRYLEDPQSCLDHSGYLPELIARSVAVKADVVSQDLKESGLRETLNYGHTFGHSLELLENYTWRHGQAVAVGMMFVASLAHARGLISSELLATHRRILSSVGLSVSYKPDCFDALLDGMTRDKKNRGGHIRFVALTGVGSTTRIEDATVDELRAAYTSIVERK